MSDRWEIAVLAYRRYPDMPLPLALACFERDRRKADLGALDERRRRRGGEVQNFKRYVPEHRQIRYHLCRHTPRRMEYERMPLERFDWSLNMASATLKTFEVPERRQHLVVPADMRDLGEQSGRRRIADTLRRARQQLRAAMASSSPPG